MRGSKDAHYNMKESEEILEDRENSFPNTKTISAEEVIPLNNLDGKNSNHSRCCKRKQMSSTKHSECGDSNIGAGDVGKPLEDHDLNENVEEKKTQMKKRASKSGNSLEAAKKKFSQSMISHRRRGKLCGDVFDELFFVVSKFLVFTCILKNVIYS